MSNEPSTPKPDTSDVAHVHDWHCHDGGLYPQLAGWHCDCGTPTYDAKPDTSDVGEAVEYAEWVGRVADALHETCLNEWRAIAAVDPKRQITQHLTDAHYGMAHDLVRRLGLAQATAQQAQRIAALEAELRKRHSRDCRTRLDSRDVPSNNTVYYCTCGILSLLSESEAK